MRVPFESELERLARTLTEQFGVQVTCKGDEAWTNGTRIVIPSVPEPIEPDLERMMVGYLDHEMAHVAFSDFGVVGQFSKKHPGRFNLLNAVEDALIERRAMHRWPGVRHNLDVMFRQIRDRVVQLAAQREPFDRFCTAVYLKLAHHNDMLGLEREVAGYEDLFDQFDNVRTTRDSADLSERILQRWLKSEQPQRSQQTDGPHNEPPPEHSSGEQHPSESPSSSNAQHSSKEGRADGSGEDAPSGSPKRRDASHTAESADATVAGTTESPGDGNGATPSNRVQSGHPDRSTSDGDAEPRTPELGPHQTGRKPRSANPRGAGGATLIGEALAEVMAECVARCNGFGHYRVYSKEHDCIETLRIAPLADINELLETGTDTVRRLRRGLTSALRSAEKRWWREDETRGVLSPRTLYRLCTDRTRLDVFRTRTMVQGKSTAVSVLLDASGSMSHPKMRVARSAMRVLLEALGDLKIATEALMFTTGRAIDAKVACRETGLDANEIRCRFGRISNLEIGLIKRFEDPVKVALQRLPSVVGTGLTPLGEAMQIAAARLAVRHENRKILLVLSDGRPGCEGGSAGALAHAQHIAKRIAKADIELVGVGILDESIGQIASESIVIHELEELPVRLCKLLGRTLKKGVCRA